MNRFAKIIVKSIILWPLTCCQRGENSYRYIRQCKIDFARIEYIVQAESDYWQKSDYPEMTVKDFLSHGFLQLDERWVDDKGEPYRIIIRQRNVTLWADGNNRINEHALGDDFAISFCLP